MSSQNSFWRKAQPVDSSSDLTEDASDIKNKAERSLTSNNKNNKKGNQTGCCSALCPRKKKELLERKNNNNSKDPEL